MTTKLEESLQALIGKETEKEAGLGKTLKRVAESASKRIKNLKGVKPKTKALSISKVKGSGPRLRYSGGIIDTPLNNTAHAGKEGERLAALALGTTAVNAIDKQVRDKKNKAKKASVTIKEAADYGEEVHALVTNILDQEGSPDIKKAAAEMSTDEFLELCNEAYMAKKASAIAVLIGEPDVAKVAAEIADIPVAELVETLQLV